MAVKNSVSLTKPEDCAVKPIEDAGALNTTLTITFLLACLYFGITVASTTHRLLLLGGSLRLPLLDTFIPVEGFYVVAPLVILGLHVYLLLQYYILVRRLRDPWTALLGNDADFFLFPALPVLRHVLRKEEPLVSALIRAGLVFTNIVLPVVVLCLAQYYFLPYHYFAITLLHQTIIVVDLLFAAYFFVVIPYRKSRNWRLLAGRVALMLCLVVPVLFFSLFLAIVPGTWVEYFLGRPFGPADKLTRNLKLADELLIAEAPSPEIIAAFADKAIVVGRQGSGIINLPDSEAVYLRFAVGARLQGRDLRNADFEQAKLFNADLRGADLTGAKLAGADLRGANLNPLNVNSRLLQQPRSGQKSEAIGIVLTSGNFKPTRLDQAGLSGVNFGQAKLILVSMVRANIEGVDLAGLELTGADLRRAQLAGSRLTGSELSHAKLDGAVLHKARLEGATVEHASLAGANLTQIEAPAASFDNADLEGAQLAEANLRCSSFADAKLIGSDLRRAHLQGAGALRVERADLRGAHLGTACDISFVRLVDLRFIDFSAPTREQWEKWRKDMGGQLAGLPLAVVEIIQSRFERGEKRIWDVWEKQVDFKMKGQTQEEIAAFINKIKTERQLPTQEFSEAQARCVGTPLDAVVENTNNQLLYLDEQRVGVLANWHPVSRQKRGGWGETMFYADLSKDLLGRICSSPGLARALTFRAAGEYAPGDQAFDFELAKQMLVKFQDLSGCEELQAFLSQMKQDNQIDLMRQIAWRVHRYENALRRSEYLVQ